jgi:uncharacterized heparinase superfamily protein
MMPHFLRLYHTVRHLRVHQIAYRLRYSFRKATPDLRPAPAVRPLSGVWHPPVAKPANMVAPDRFRFLNETQTLVLPADWNNPTIPKLWLYNLHYFDDLVSDDAECRKDWHRALSRRWIDENPPGMGNGWEPYPISLRTVNWIKWALVGHPLPDATQHSLAVQVRFLRQRLEYHLLGNHLWANGKALIFAGLFFEGPEAQGWLHKGLEIVHRELIEQVLPDGGHFERSPMYHAIILEDLLDLVNLFGAYQQEVPQDWTTAAAMMRTWLQVLSHPDGRIGFFNDAAFGIAADWQVLDTYAQRLGLGAREHACPVLTRFPESGYLRLENRQAVALLDVAPVGPDYIPGHAHADTLSFELSVFGRRVLVNGGTSTYEKTAERERQRGTAAHNTVIVNEADSSEVWGGFRVARRARPLGLETRVAGETCRVKCAHDGYHRLPGKPIHGRDWHWQDGRLTVRDRIAGSFKTARARYHFHPELDIQADDAGRGRAVLPNGQAVQWHIQQGRAKLVDGTWHPEFGLTLPNRCLEVEFQGPEVEVVFSWPISF